MRYKIALLLLPLVVSSCKLDYTPENAITYTNAFASESELNTTTSSIHFYMNNCMDAVSVLTQAGLRADETQSADELREWNPQTILQSGADWTGVYDMIFEANLLLDNIHRTQGLTEDRYNYHTGQAHFALGLGYFLLSRGYGEAVVTANSKDIRIYPLSSMLEVVNKGIEHAERAYSILPTYDKLRSVSGGTLSSKQYALCVEGEHHRPLWNLRGDLTDCLPEECRVLYEDHRGRGWSLFSCLYARGSLQVALQPRGKQPRGDL